MQLFVRNLVSRSVCYELCADDTVGALKQHIEAHDGVPQACQGLVHGGRQLHDDSRTLQQCGVSAGSTVHLVLRLVGGKGGFGALLRGQGRNGEITTNYDACRDLTGRRLRHSEAEKKLREWRACQKERDAAVAADKKVRDEEKQAAREAAAEVDEVQVREEQKRATRQVLEAVRNALTDAPLPAVAAAAAKRKAAGPPLAQAAAGTLAKRTKNMMSALDAISSDDESSDEGQDEARAEVEVC